MHLHSTKDLGLAENIVVILIPPYCRELNPAEKVRQRIQDEISMIFFDTLEIPKIKWTASQAT